MDDLDKAYDDLYKSQNFSVYMNENKPKCNQNYL
ncbi:MAG: hypothetical protein Satyrvirus4_24 [Satyrvirus sp.]|uniref:Uncharacterized protein n=1 Tax=Satyrvirus sp. TaxID=2487771 RepID=A0A3G5AD88_9VIRU|nr:MAG: hypothetical protein Satyrvirus4_24 [Satyrvirus sp.]